MLQQLLFSTTQKEQFFGHPKTSVWTVLKQKLNTSFLLYPSQTPSHEHPTGSNFLVSYKVKHRCGAHQI